MHAVTANCCCCFEGSYALQQYMMHILAMPQQPWTSTKALFVSKVLYGAAQIEGAGSSTRLGTHLRQVSKS
eukprot:4559-Heterococcus_DN1.PRE.1